ncbi:MAG: archease [Candidatus Omnitrophica bacterium]|jgi:SHS2 domain-containing protein|nr:archease [Candidatus Omnitrophota bacterium]MDD3988154.1 archease [Candidatus Omnitrophota bacterium]MDD4981243.1 archease [Candidatus Omnitrophota bacterium]MDD5664752.1 archease [Candidatus Omnitrophota bacterium]
MTIKYEIIDHTADIGLKIIGSDLKELFENSGLSLFQISSRKQFTKDKKHISVVIKQKSENIEELFINWLNELLSLSAARELIFHHIKVNKINETGLEAICQGSSINNYKVNIEIKAATYHNLSIKNNEKGWEARVILDV